MAGDGYLRDISVPVFIAVCVFAISSWIDLNAVWVEIPLMVNVLPEGWNLPSYLVIIIQIANVGALTFTIAKKLAPRKVQEWWVIYVIIGIGLMACLLLVFFWHKTTYIGGEEHSTALLVLTFFLALVDCTSSVVFLPYMAQFASQYLTAFYIGEGLSGLLPSVLGLIQGVGNDPECVNTTDPTSNGTEFIIVPRYHTPLFSVGVFFGILFTMLCGSAVAFSLLRFHPKFSARRDASSSPDSDPHRSSEHSGDADRESLRSYDENSRIIISSYHNSSNNRIDEPMIVETSASSSVPTFGASNFSVSNIEVIFQLVTIGWINALTNGFLPAVQSYACLPYGNLVYNLAVRLSVLANPVACFFGLFFRVRSTVVCVAMATVGTVLAGYQIALASLSPEPPLRDQAIGDVLAVSTFVLLTAICSFTKMSIATLLSGRGGARALLWCGGVTQIGSCVGAIVAFLLVNVAKIFKSKSVCS